MKKLLLSFLALAFSLSLQAQKKVTVSGHITDAETGETLIGAGVLVGNASGKTPDGTVTNLYGYYTLTIPGGRLSLQYSFVGYENSVVELDLVRDTVINISLNPSAVLSEAVVVARKEAGIQSTYLGSMDIPLAHVQNTPVLFGESDVLKALQMMPGVQGGMEGFTGLYVRGGGPDENLILLDGCPIYNVDHLLGLFSVFQSEAVKKVTLYKGSFPARYGGRISSIVDIRTNDGNMKETHGTVGIGLISDKLHLEGPIVKDKLSYSISARGMHTAVFAPFIKLLLRKTGEYYNYYFYDLNGKLTWRISDKDRLYAGIYNGNDMFRASYDDTSASDEGSRVFYRDKMGLTWGNTVASLRWNHVFGSKLFANTTVSYNRYKMDVNVLSREKGVNEDGTKYSYKFTTDYASGIRDLGAVMDFDYNPVPGHMIKFGTEYIFHMFRPQTLAMVENEQTGSDKTETPLYNGGNDESLGGHEISLYAEDDFSLGKNFTLNPGVHLTLFGTDGRAYLSAQPRLAARYHTQWGFSVKAGYARMAQYVHLLSSSQVSLPIDLWVPITKDIRPVTSNQYTAGLYYDGLKGWEFSVEAYYKQMNNILEYKDGSFVLGTASGWQDKVEMGKGRAMGLEFFVEKTAGKTTGWISYTLAKSDRRFPGGTINHGEWFPYKYDRRHNLNLTLNQKLGRKVDLSASFNIASGGMMTLPERRTNLIYPDGSSDMDVDYISGRNNYRLPPSHRLNIGFNFHRYHPRWEGVWNISIYNVYNQMNPNFVFLNFSSKYDPSTGATVESYGLKKVTILPILPSFGYTAKF